jgi:hypothetical protein
MVLFALPMPVWGFGPAKPPTVELNEVQPAAAAAEPNDISGIRPTVEPDKAPAEFPAAAVEQNEALPRSSAAGSELRNWATEFILTLIVVAVSSSAPAASAHAKFF